MALTLPRRNKAVDGVRGGLLLNPERTSLAAQALEQSLENLVVGQPEASAQIVNAYQTFLAGLNPPNRPVANFLFLGPTGTGKTRAVEAFAESLVGTSKAVLKVDCGEFQHSQEIAKLVGSPPGYLGHRETMPVLSQDNLNQYRNSHGALVSFVLFDEIEKASDALWNLLLGILDKGTLTLGDNRRVDFSRAMIFLTSNLGAREMESLVTPGVGFIGVDRPPDAGRLAKSAIEAARKRFTPEFMNRLDKVVVFQPLSQSSMTKILDLELSFVQRRVVASDASAPFVFTVSEAAKAQLIRMGTTARYGARHLKRVLNRELVQPLANLVATGQARRGDWIHIEPSESGSERQLQFRRAGECLSADAMAGIFAANSLAPVVEFNPLAYARAESAQAVGGRARR